MGVSKYVSDVKSVNNSQEVVYNFLSDFNNFGLFFNEYTLQKMAEQMPDAQISNFRADTDSCHFTVSKLGEVGLSAIEREAPKMIKVTGAGNIPFEIFLWIQILPVTAYQCKMRLTLHADLNMMMKMMVGNKMKDGINKLADMLTMLPYR